MEQISAIKMTEDELVAMINTHLPVFKDFDSIVANEELGNQDWSVSLSKADADDFDILKEPDDVRWRTQELMGVLCYLGHLPEGDYLIDCTW